MRADRGDWPCGSASGRNPDNPYLHDSATGMPPQQLERALRDGELDVTAGTAWLWARSVGGA